MSPPLLVQFTAGAEGDWRIERVSPAIGETLPDAPRLAVTTSAAPASGAWLLRGFTSNVRYATRGETEALRAAQEDLGRASATHAALIPVKKTERWWALAQDERRAIMEERSRHIAIGLDYLPAVARRLHHSRDLGEPFDFLTWFEYAPSDAADFERLVQQLRETEEWSFVEREVDIRLVRD